MNEFCNLVSEIKDNDVIVLEKNKIYDVRQDDSFSLKGFYCSNTAKKHENPDGTRYSALYLDGKNIFGYNKTINDSTKGSLTCNPRYKTKTKNISKNSKRQ